MNSKLWLSSSGVRHLADLEDVKVKSLTELTWANNMAGEYNVGSVTERACRNTTKGWTALANRGRTCKWHHVWSTLRPQKRSKVHYFQGQNKSTHQEGSVPGTVIYLIRSFVRGRKRKLQKASVLSSFSWKSYVLFLGLVVTLRLFLWSQSDCGPQWGDDRTFCHSRTQQDDGLAPIKTHNFVGEVADNDRCSELELQGLQGMSLGQSGQVKRGHSDYFFWCVVLGWDAR